MSKGSGGTRYYRPESVQSKASRTITRILSDIGASGYSKEQPFKIGGVEERMKQHAADNGIELGSQDVYMSSAQIGHAMRDTKAADGKIVSRDALVEFPLRRYGMKLYHDSSNGNYVYFDGVNKYVLHPNYQIKIGGNKTKSVNFITASLCNGQEFAMKKYTEVKKK